MYSLVSLYDLEIDFITLPSILMPKDEYSHWQQVLWNYTKGVHSKVDQTSAPVYKSCGFLGERPISSSNMLFKIDCFSRWPLLLSWALKYRILIWDLQNQSSKVMRKSNWLNIILIVSFMTLNILNLNFVFTFLEFIINLRS